MSETFAFGKNWAKFLQVVNDERIDLATQSVRRLTGRDRLDGLRFLDIGSGSGLFSLAARKLGADVTSFDVDIDSVACTREMKRRYAPNDPQWRIEQGSVLDRDFVASFGSFDVVYSWGVLHHTGSMWPAIENAVSLVSPDGTFCIALYNDQGRQSRVWMAIKRTYQRVPAALQPAYAACVIAPWQLRRFLPHPIRQFHYWKNYAKISTRGMSYWRDVIDWVGGYPFETASPADVVGFCSSRGFLLYALTTVGTGHGCNEFGFLKSPLAGRHVTQISTSRTRQSPSAEPHGATVSAAFAN